MAPILYAKLPVPWQPPRRQNSSLTAFISAATIILLALLYLASYGASCCGRGRHVPSYRGYRSAFSFDADSARRPDWMAALPDDTPLGHLSIPGTHDTMTYALVRSALLQCQTLNLSAQLDAGVRYVDIRARLRASELRIYHADGDTGFRFADVLLALFAFLNAHPSEGVIMRLKEEGPPLPSAVADDDKDDHHHDRTPLPNRKNTAASFEEAFNHDRLVNPATVPGARRHLLQDDRAPLPTLGALRSRILPLQEFAAGASYGPAWVGAYFVLEDAWIVPDVYHLADKWAAARGALEAAATAPPDDARLFLAHLSASVGVLPVEAAGGPANRCVTGLNDLAGQWLRDFARSDDAARAGVVIADFPGRQLVDAVLAWNRKLVGTPKGGR